MKTEHRGSPVIKYVSDTLIGPKNGEAETVTGDAPGYRYSMGILFPKGATTDQLVEEDSPEVGSTGSLSSDDGEPDDPLTLANQQLPSSAGMSFFLAGTPEFRCRPVAAVYEPDGNGTWTRRQLQTKYHHVVSKIGSVSDRISILEGYAELYSKVRAIDNGFLVTVAIVNVAEPGERSPGALIHDPVGSLFQVGMEVNPGEGGGFGRYPRRFNSMAGVEEAELELLYLNRSTYAIGHGCAVSWDAEENPERISIEFMPVVEVPKVIRSADSASILNLSYLVNATPDELQQGFSEFLSKFSNWVEELRTSVSSRPGDLIQAANSLMAKLDRSVDRMKAGAELISTNPDVFRSFQIANNAMMMQMFHAGPSFAGARKGVDDPVDFPSRSDYLNSSAKWYPFQLAFLLLTAPSIVDLAHPDRDVVDLIWFPTGGGKTEAYFGAAAFEIALRRLRNPESGGGTAVVSRYTLRLLTSQQFQRTAGLVCALETIRREDPSTLGLEPITLGLWVGGGETPNREEDALELGNEVLNGIRTDNPFGLDRCPWCGTAIVPESRTRNPDDYGFTLDGTGFKLRCPRVDCPFHPLLPVLVVDEDLYEAPPTILMGTVDKFAQLTWRREPGRFFGSGTHMPPGLIIQDELHLLSGPLGTTYGVYEAAIETIIRLNGGRPKIVASTATIRDAGSQARGLFGKQIDVFPARGLDEADSYFARTDFDNPGRMYAGILSSHHTSVTSLVRTTGTLAQSVRELTLDDEQMDSYWTQVVFHNSLRELGNFLTQARDDVDSFIRVIASDASVRRVIGHDDVLEVSSNVGPGSPGAITSMEIPWDQPGAVSIVACSNMFSVGVDVQRLGLMVMNGQPRSTSEYIQATSRVGRSETPGIVFTHLSSTKPRDRSHYESFTAYHHSLYRYVEPTSVTPMALPSRLRSLHAAAVITIRHGAGYVNGRMAGEVDFDSEKVKYALSELVERFAASDPAAEPQIRSHMDRIIERWKELQQLGERGRRPLWYRQEGTPVTPLLKNFGDTSVGFETPNSMRNVDSKVWVEPTR